MNFEMKQFDKFSDQILIFVLPISFQLETVIDKSRADPDANTGSGSLGTSGNGKSPSKVTLNETIWRGFFVLISFFAGNGKSTLKVTFSEEDLLQQDMSEQLEKDKANVRQNDSEFCRFVSMELYALETRQTQFLRFLKFRYF